MCVKEIFILFVLVLSPNLIYSHLNTFPSEFDFLLSINSYVDEIRAEQNLIVLKLNELSESFKHMEAEIKQSKDELRQIKIGQIDINNDLKQKFSESFKHMEAEMKQSKDELRQIKIGQIDINNDLKQTFSESLKHMEAEIKQPKDELKQIKISQTDIINKSKQKSDDTHVNSKKHEKVQKVILSIEDIIEQIDQSNSNQAQNLYPRSCDHDHFLYQSGIREILVPSFSQKPFEVFCDGQRHHGGWIVLLRRLNGSVNFNRNWSSYKEGFGDLNGEFFLGLDKIHALTSDNEMELIFILEDFDNQIRYAKYDSFAIGSEEKSYILNTLGDYEGTAGDSFTYHFGNKFSTIDRDNDNWMQSCAAYCTGGWWYDDCQESNLAGQYGDNSKQKGINWLGFKGYTYSLKRAEMMIRPEK